MDKLDYFDILAFNVFLCLNFILSYERTPNGNLCFESNSPQNQARYKLENYIIKVTYNL